VRIIIEKAHDRAREILKDNGEALIRISEALLERETLGVEELTILVEGGTLPAPAPVDPPAPESDDAMESPASSSTKHDDDSGALPAPDNQPA